MPRLLHHISVRYRLFICPVQKTANMSTVTNLVAAFFRPASPF